MHNGRFVAAARSRRGALALLGACHPEPAALVTLLVAALALAAGRGWGTIWVAAAVAAGQLSVGWSNDYLDRELDRAAGRSDKPLATGAGALRPATVRTAALVALAASVPISLAVSVGFAAAHLTAVGWALAYNLGLKAGPFSVVPYAVAFGLVPVAVALGLPNPHWPPLWAIGAAVMVGAGGHFTQAMPDIPADRRSGVQGLPQRIGQRASGAAAALLLLAANLVVAAAGETASSLAALHAGVSLALATGILLATFQDRHRLAFRLTLAAAAVAVLALVAGGSRL